MPPTTAPASADPQPSVRQGPELIRATAAFEPENRWFTWLLLLQTLAVLAAFLFVAVWVQPWPIKVLAGMMAGLLQVRLFIFYHDAVHGALFREAPLAQAIMSGIGFYLVSVRSVWKESHDFHHQNNGKILSSAIGSYPILTVEMVRTASGRQLRQYRFLRHPLTIAGGYLTVFMLGMAVLPFLRKWRRHWAAPIAVLVHIGIFLLAGFTGGWLAAVCAVLIPSVVSMALGSYLFYAQHNFPAMQIGLGADWSYTKAALVGSSMFDMSRMMHWFTGNIGFHHVHHVNHRIPFYRLREAMRAIPELQSPGRTSWRIGDILACLRLYVWDAEQGRMLTYAEAR